MNYNSEICGDRSDTDPFDFLFYCLFGVVLILLLFQMDAGDRVTPGAVTEDVVLPQ